MYTAYFKHQLNFCVCVCVCTIGQIMLLHWKEFTTYDDKCLPLARSQLQLLQTVTEKNALVSLNHVK